MKRLRSVFEHSYDLKIFTFEDAFKRYQFLCENYSHFGFVKMLYSRGEWLFEYFVDVVN